MKKILSVMLACTLVLGSATALAASQPKYTMATDGVVLQDAPDRNITPKTDLSLNPVIEGVSPTTGLPYDTSLRYSPLLVQISNPNGTLKIDGKKVTSAGIGPRAPWGGQYADIVYEGILERTGETRITFLFNDSFAEGQPTSVGPVRSCRIGHILLREEWGGGIIYAGGPRAEENNIALMFAELGATDKGVTFNLLDNKYQELKYRLKNLKRPDNYNIDAVGFRNLVPETTIATPHPFLFADESPYTDGYELAYSINLDWGHKNWISHFYYDENNNLYLRYSGAAPYMTFATADDANEQNEDNQEQMSFSNVIVQRVTYEYAQNKKAMPVMNNVGKGNADIFIGGRYIPGYWVREAIETPTIYFDDQGNELQLTPGKTFIAHLPPSALLTYQGAQ